MSPAAAVRPAAPPPFAAPAAPAAPEAAPVVVQSRLFGEITVPARAVLTFPQGLFGFPECRRFALVPVERVGLFWLLSVEHAPLAFLLVDPFPHFPGYTVELGPERAAIGATEADEVAVLCILTLPHTRREPPTANLQGPLALNLRTGLAQQLALGDDTFGTRCPVHLP